MANTSTGASLARPVPLVEGRGGARRITGVQRSVKRAVRLAHVASCRHLQPDFTQRRARRHGVPEMALRMFGPALRE
jgi:hypothetical protein